MQVSIKRTDLEKYVEEQVRTGHFPSAEAVVENALETVKVQQELPGWSDEELRAEINTGIEELDRGHGTEWDVEEIIREARQEHAARKSSNAPHS